jgi:dimethylamine/trimethylamine dehydrogenase
MRMTMEQLFVQHRLMNLGVKIVSHHGLAGAEGGRVTFTCNFTSRETVLEDHSVVTVTARLPRNAIHRDLMNRREAWEAAGIRSVTLVGDALAPGTIAAAVWAGRRFAEDLDAERGPVATDMRREVTGLSAGPFYWERAAAAG